MMIVEEKESESSKLMKRIVKAKVELTMLKQKRRLLLEEIHRQFLEGELEPKKRLKPFNDKKRKLKD